MVNSYVSGDIDSTELVTILNTLGISVSPLSYLQPTSDLTIDELITYLNTDYPESGLSTYFNDLSLRASDLFMSIERFSSTMTEEEIRQKMTTALPFVLSKIQENSKSIIPESGECAACYLEFDTCLENRDLALGGTVAGATFISATILGYTNYMGPVSWGTAGIAFFSGATYAGINWVTSTFACRNSLETCIEVNGCSPGGGLGGNPLQWINKT